MKKLHFLKNIVNYVWWTSLFFVPILIIFSILKLFNFKLFGLKKFEIKMFGENIIIENYLHVLMLLMALLSFGIALFALFHFKKLLHNFSSKIIFVKENVIIFKRIGNLTLSSACFYMISNLFFMLSKDTIKIELGYGSFIIALAIGLFFIVLSEVFDLANKMKQENDLTI